MTRHLLVIGAQRCGTTYLHDLLAEHPQIAMARPARPEPKVLLSEELSARGREWYVRTYFAHADREVVLGEKSTSYLEYAAAAERAAVMLGDPLVVVQLRDPVQRALSHWAFSTDAGLETRPLERALTENLAGPLPWDPSITSVSPYAYLERGRYVEHLAPWRARFGDDLVVLLLEELRADPAVVAGLYDRLGVDPGYVPAALGTPVNESRRPRPALDADLLRRLRAYYGDSDQELTELLGRSLPWREPTEPRRGDS